MCGLFAQKQREREREREIGTMVFCLWPPLPLACDEVIKGDCGGGGKLMNLVSGGQNRISRILYMYLRQLFVFRVWKTDLIANSLIYSLRKEVGIVDLTFWDWAHH